MGYRQKKEKRLIVMLQYRYFGVTLHSTEIDFDLTVVGLNPFPAKL